MQNDDSKSPGIGSFFGLLAMIGIPAALAYLVFAGVSNHQEADASRQRLSGEYQTPVARTIINEAPPFLIIALEGGIQQDWQVCLANPFATADQIDACMAAAGYSFTWPRDRNWECGTDSECVYEAWDYFRQVYGMGG